MRRLLSVYLRRHRGPLGRAALVLGLIAAVLVAARQPLIEQLWPQGRAELLEAEAERALAAGKLTHPDGRGARELYRAALAVDPDRPQPRQGLRRVGEAALEAGYRAAGARRYDEAKRLLALAREMQVPVALSEGLAAFILEREAADADIDRLLAAAAKAREAGGLDTAAAHYRRVLELEPGHQHALEGREDVLADMLQQAQKALGEGRPHVAATLILAVRGYDPGHVDLPATIAALSAAAERERRRGDLALRRWRLEEATAAYFAASAADSERERALQGLERVARAYAQRSRRDLARGRLPQARRALQAAQAIAPDLPAVRDARTALARAEREEREQRRPLARRAAPPNPAQVERLLREAEAAERRGDLLLPPGESAFDKLRAARSAAPDDARVQVALARLRPTARDCYERELERNNLSRAQHCLDALEALSGAPSDIGPARVRLAQRWIAVGHERLSAGEITAAHNALNSARALEPATPGLQELSERLRQATAGR